ncbi:sulfate adenylyltransferase subunit CysN [Gammaproteobacteria bacterium]|nr:sulfate adenylyltransferase subunit CysN [Gammaproteobacteria bacterium]
MSTELSDPHRIQEYIDRQMNLDLLRFITCGSVDDGKSTLIGRMLYEAQLIFDDQVASLQNDSKKHGTQEGEIDFALLVDGLSAEREQGITIDVAYRFFGTDHRKFIVADTPGHEQYTRNMVTGASTADVAVILVDAKQGILVQTRRHSFLTSLLGVKHVVLAVNKMDLIDYDEEAYQLIVEDYRSFSKKLNFDSITPIPLSALKGDNVIKRSSQTNWYKGPTLLGYLETVDIFTERRDEPFRFPVQWVNRPNSHFRGFSGSVISGGVQVGDEIRVLPSGQTAMVETIVLLDQELESAVKPQAVTLTLNKEIDASRGDVVVKTNQPCEVSDQFDCNLVWLNEEEGYVGRAYWLMLGTQRVNATLSEIKFKYNVNTLEELPARGLALNDIGRVTLSCDKAIPFEAYDFCREMGSLILIDRFSNATVGAGMVNFALRRAQNIHRHHHAITKKDRARMNGHRGRILWLTGLSGSGKSTIANELEKRLFIKGRRTYVLDGDNVRHGLNKDLGFTNADRVENIRRVAEVSRLMVDAGLVVITAFISPFRSEREVARTLFEKEEFDEVFVNVALEVAELRDPKGLYKKARQGDLPNFTGIDSDYEVPLTPDIEVNTDQLDLEACVSKILGYLEDTE